MKIPIAALVLLLGAMPIAAQTECADCHAETAASMGSDVHLRVRPFEVGGRTAGCAGCHGDGAAHAESGDATLIRTFEEGTVSERNAVCLGCHDRKGQIGWATSTHAAEGLACTECHRVHDDAPRSQPLASCTGCHADQTTRFQLPSHHPVREGQMNCASCHDVHSGNDKQLVTAQRTNDLCYTCHPAHEGPFIFEHEPVTEDCMTCHDPHGSVSNNLLTASEPALCLQCHDFHFHAGYESVASHEVGGIERTSPLGATAFNAGFTTKCTQCHSRIHGTDLPSQTVPGRGRALMR